MNKLLLLKMDFIPKQAINPFIMAKQNAVTTQKVVPTVASVKRVIPTRKVFQNNIPIMNSAPATDEAVIGGVRKIKSSKKGKAQFQRDKKEILNSYFDNEKLIDRRQENLEEMVNDIVAKDRAKAKAQAEETGTIYFDDDDFDIF